MKNIYSMPILTVGRSLAWLHLAFSQRIPSSPLHRAFLSVEIVASRFRPFNRFLPAESNVWFLKIKENTKCTNLFYTGENLETVIRFMVSRRAICILEIAVRMKIFFIDENLSTKCILRYMWKLPLSHISTETFIIQVQIN